MIDRMDRNIGRLLKTLNETGKADNTVIFFLSDNGACKDSADRSTVKGTMPWEVHQLSDPRPTVGQCVKHPVSPVQDNRLRGWNPHSHDCPLAKSHHAKFIH